MRLDEIGDRIEPHVQRLRLARLHQAQMALGQRDCIVARQRADDRNTHRLDRLDDEPAMALAADAIDDDARDLQPLVIRSAALDDRRRRLRLARHVDDQQDRHAERRRHIGRGAGAPRLARDAVEQPHRGFAQSERALSRRSRRERGQKARPHRPGIEVDAFAPRRRGMEGRIDIVRAGLEADTSTPRRLNARRRPSAAVVLPLPERGAAIMRPRVIAESLGKVTDAR